jgi:hypothetical protein
VSKPSPGSNIPRFSRSLSATNILTDTCSISAGLRGSEDAVSAAISAADLIRKESVQLRLSPDSQRIRPAADTATDTASSDARKPALIFQVSVKILGADKLWLKRGILEPLDVFPVLAIRVAKSV